MKMKLIIGVGLLTLVMMTALGCSNKNNAETETETVAETQEKETTKLSDHVKNVDKMAVVVNAKDVDLEKVISDMADEDIVIKSVDDSQVDYSKPGTYPVKVSFEVVDETKAEMISASGKKEDKKAASSTASEAESKSKEPAIMEESIHIEVIESDTTDKYLDDDYIVIDQKGEVIQNDSAKKESKKDDEKADKETEAKRETSAKDNKKETTAKNTNKDTGSGTVASKPQSSGNNSGNTGSSGNSGSQSQTPAPTPTPSGSTKPQTPSTPSGSTGTSKPETKPSTPAHTHNWVEQYKTIHHDAEGHYEDVLVQEAYDEEVTEEVYDPWECCGICGADITSDPSGHLEVHALNGDQGRGVHTEMYKTVTTTVHHDAVYESRWVETAAAYDEKVSDGYICSGCGARK